MGLMTLMAFLVGCDEIKFNGVLGVHEIMTFAQEGEDPYTCQQKPDYWNCKPAGNAVVNPGQFNTKAILSGDNQQKQITLEIKNGQNPTVVDLKFDKNIETGDHFLITAAQLKQNFDLAGDIVTQVTRTPEQSGTESCTYQAQEMVCRSMETVKSDDSSSQALGDLTALADELGLKPGHFPGGQQPGHGGPQPGHFPGGQQPGHGGPQPGHFPGGQQPDHGGPQPGSFPGTHGPQPYPGPVCHPVWVSRPGYQYVRFYYETTTKDITAKFLQGDKNLADYQGQSSNTKKIYTYQDTCR